MRSKAFTRLAKEKVSIWVPPEVALRLRLRAAKQLKSSSEVGTELLALSLGLDPGKYGIGATKGHSQAPTN